MSDIATHFGTIADFMELCEEALEMNLSGWEVTFVEDLMEKAEEYGDDCYLSDKQADKLREIMERHA